MSSAESAECIKLSRKATESCYSSRAVWVGLFPRFFLYMYMASAGFGRSFTLWNSSGRGNLGSACTLAVACPGGGCLLNECAAGVAFLWVESPSGGECFRSSRTFR